MKFPARRSAGFTLVELLVVIAIIAILAAVITVSAGAAINAAKRGKALNTANQIQSAILNYDTEYGVYPLSSTDQPAGSDYLEGKQGSTTTDTDEENLFWALCGNLNAYTATAQTGTVSNTRNIVFLTPKRSEVDANGTPLNPFSSGGKNYYFSIAMDGDYDGILGDSGSAQGAIPDFVTWTNGQTSTTTIKLTQAVAVWACCDPANLATPTASTSPTLWVHTY